MLRARNSAAISTCLNCSLHGEYVRESVRNIRYGLDLGMNRQVEREVVHVVGKSAQESELHLSQVHALVVRIELLNVVVDLQGVKRAANIRHRKM